MARILSGFVVAQQPSVRLFGAMSVLVVGLVVAGCKEPCTAASCEGCCDELGGCDLGTSRFSCGAKGAACATCASSEVCAGQQCQPRDGGPDAGCGCPGCCWADGGCGAGNLVEACAPRGGRCTTCGVDERCDVSGCTSMSCGGCLDVGGACRPGTTDVACGSAGGLCVACLGTQHCVAGRCELQSCSPASCPRGCCATPTQCQSPATDVQCGLAGSTCMSCGGSTHCNSAGQCE